MTPRPIFRVLRVASAICGMGKTFFSITRSRNRVAILEVSRSRASSNAPSFTQAARLMLPSTQLS